MDSSDRDISKKTKMEVGEEKKRKSKKKSPPCVSSPSSSSIATTVSSSSGGDGGDGFAQSEKPRKPKRSRRKDINESDSTSPPRRSSMYRGVTRHRWTGRYEAHLWDRDCWNAIQSKKGRQVYLGAYDDEEAAARTYDLAALKYWGSNTLLNFPFETYAREFEEMQAMTREEYLASLRRNSSGFSRGASKYRGVARHHHNGRWEARIGRIYGNKYLYLGTFSTQEEAAQAYDIAAIEYRGINAVTNFDISRYSEYLNLPPPPESDTSPPPPPPEAASSVEPPPSINIDEDDLWSVCVDPVTGAFESLTNGNIDYYFEDNIDCYFEESEMIGSNNVIGIGGCEGNSIEVAKGDGGGEGLFEGKGGEEVGLMEVDLYSCSISICS